MGFLWGAKDDLPADGLACVGKHLARVSACIAPRLLPTLVASRADAAPEGLEAEVVAGIQDGGPATGPELRAATGSSKKDVDKAVASPHPPLRLAAPQLLGQDGPRGAPPPDPLR